ncbi:MAG: molybdenum cofactor guanylyltransferase [Aureliella sp.]
MDSGLRPSACPAYVLAGGQSKRFGSDKARVVIDGKLQVQRLAEMLKRHGHEVTVVASENDLYRDLDLCVIADHQAGLGPMMGVATALTDRIKGLSRTPSVQASVSGMPSRDGWILALSVDQFLWKPDWFAALAGEVQGTVNAVSYCFEAHGRSSGERTLKTQPLPGLFHVSLLPSFERFIACGQLALRSVIEESHGVSIPSDDNPANWSFNDRSSLQRLIQLSQRS